MDMQAEAERKKRATVLDSEGQQQSEINKANGFKQATVLRAEGEAEAIKVHSTLKIGYGVEDSDPFLASQARALATAESLRNLSAAIKEKGGSDAVTMRVAEQYVEAFGKIAKSSTTMLLPGNVADAGSMVAQAMAVYNKLTTKNSPAPVETAPKPKLDVSKKDSDFTPAKF